MAVQTRSSPLRGSDLVRALTMDGIGPAVATARISQKAPLRGLFASVRRYGRLVGGKDGSDG